MHPIDQMVCQCCGHDINDLPVTFNGGPYHDCCRSAILHEREACAQVAGGYWIGFPDADNEVAHRASLEIPMAIRNRD